MSPFPGFVTVVTARAVVWMSGLNMVFVVDVPHLGGVAHQVCPIQVLRLLQGEIISPFRGL